MIIDQAPWKNRVSQWVAWVSQSKGGVFLLCLIFTLALLYEYIFPLDRLVEDRDYVIQLWNLWWVNEAIKSGHNPYVTELLFYPVGANLARYNLSPGFFPITFLVDTLSGGDALYPFYTRRILVWLCFSLLFCSSYLLLRKIGLSFWAALTPAVAYSFSDFYLHHINTALNILSGFFIPLTALCLIHLFQKPKLSNALLSAVLLAAALYFTELILYIYMSIILFGLAMSIFPEQRRLPIHKIRQLGPKPLAVSGLVFGLVAAPFLVNWFASEANPPDLGQASLFSANLLGFFLPFQVTTPLYGPLFAPWSDWKLFAGRAGYALFIGFPFLLLGVISSLQRSNPEGKMPRQWLKICLGLAFVFFVLSLGPTLKLYKFDTGLLMPYALIGSMPPFNIGRTPFRFAGIGLFFWMIVAAYGVQWLYCKLRFNYGPWLARGAMLLIFLWTTAEVYSPPLEPQQVFVIPQQLANVAEGPVIELPLKLHHGWTLLYQMFHRQPLAVGEVSRNSEAQLRHFETLRVFYAEALQTGTCRRFEEMGFRTIIIRSGIPDDVVYGLTHSPHCSLNVIDWR